jgi:hypothetical protein
MFPTTNLNPRIIETTSSEEGVTNRTFTLGVDITVDLDDILRGILSNDIPPEIAQKAKDDIQALWDSSDLDIIDIIVRDLENTLEGATSITPREFNRKA